MALYHHPFHQLRAEIAAVVRTLVEPAPCDDCRHAADCGPEFACRALAVYIETGRLTAAQRQPSRAVRRDRLRRRKSGARTKRCGSGCSASGRRNGYRRAGRARGPKPPRALAHSSPCRTAPCFRGDVYSPVWASKASRWSMTVARLYTDRRVQDPAVGPGCDGPLVSQRAITGTILLRLFARMVEPNYEVCYSRLTR
jgi:hypothetical protein